MVSIPERERERERRVPISIVSICINCSLTMSIEGITSRNRVATYQKTVQYHTKKKRINSILLVAQLYSVLLLYSRLLVYSLLCVAKTVHSLYHAKKVSLPIADA